MQTTIALTIAGSDSGGGAGIQADLKTFSALGAFGCSVIAALTAQNTKAVTAIMDIPPSFVAEQIDAVFSDISVSAVKIGMLNSAAIIDVVADRLQRYKPQWIVVDPVMVAKSGDRLLHEDAVNSLRDRLLPLATLITPNLPEAADLLGIDMPTNREKMYEAASALLALGSQSVLIKGGHLSGASSPDLLLSTSTPNAARWFESERAHTKNTHGSGCTLSSAIAALLPRYRDIDKAVAHAKSYIQNAINNADKLNVGSGHGPLHHFYQWW